MGVVVARLGGVCNPPFLEVCRNLSISLSEMGIGGIPDEVS